MHANWIIWIVAPTTTCLAFVRLTNLVAADILTAFCVGDITALWTGWVDGYVAMYRIALLPLEINANAHFWSTVRTAIYCILNTFVSAAIKTNGQPGQPGNQAGCLVSETLLSSSIGVYLEWCHRSSCCCESVTDMQGQVKVESFVYFATRFFF